MATEYPEGLDEFSVPSLPEDTPLSQAGPGNTRNLVESVRDQGDAIEALQEHASQKTHDHSGDDETVSGPKLDQDNTHENADTDTGGAIHHTLGLGQYQAAAGNHVHDYAGSTIINKPFELCTSTSRPTPFLGKTIWELDTNRMRIWAQFPGVQTQIQGTYGVDNFTRTSSLNLGTTLWDQWYANANGKMATPTGNSASWIETGGSYNRCIARRVNSADKYTLTYDQVIIIDTNTETAEWDYPSPTNPASVDAFFRMSDDKQEYIRAALTWWKGYTGHIMLTWTDSGPGGEQLIGTLPAHTNQVNASWQLRMVGNRFEVYMGIERVGEIIDNVGVTSLLNKGWGIGMQAGDPYPYGSYTQVKPSQIDFVTIADASYFTSDVRWQLLPVGVVPRVGLAGTAPQQINPTGSVIEWGHVEEDNFGMFDPGVPTSVRIKEAGIYQVHASLVWATALRGDQAGIGLLINDQQTAHQHWEFVRGFNYQPGFSQTTDVTAYVRLAEGDRIGVVAAHNGAYSQYTGHKKAPAEDIVQISRFFLMFHSP